MRCFVKRESSRHGESPGESPAQAWVRFPPVAYNLP